MYLNDSDFECCFSVQFEGLLIFDDFPVKTKIKGHKSN